MTGAGGIGLHSPWLRPGCGGPSWWPWRAHSLSLPGQVRAPNKFVASKGLVLECPRAGCGPTILYNRALTFIVPFRRYRWAGKVTCSFLLSLCPFGTLVFRARVGSSPLQSHRCIPHFCCASIGALTLLPFPPLFLCRPYVLNTGPALPSFFPPFPPPFLFSPLFICIFPLTS